MKEINTGVTKQREKMLDFLLFFSNKKLIMNEREIKRQAQCKQKYIFWSKKEIG